MRLQEARALSGGPGRGNRVLRLPAPRGVGAAGGRADLDQRHPTTVSACRITTTVV